MLPFVLKLFVSLFIFFSINISNVLSANDADTCSVQKQNFTLCMQELEDRNLLQDDGQTKIVRNKISGCFTE